MMQPLKFRKRFGQVSFLFLLMFISICSFSQKDANSQLEKMPADLERDFALSSLPAHLRSDATVYLLDPQSGYYVARKGSNGFICFVMRTAWEWGEFRKDLYTAIAYDAEGAKTIFPAYLAAAAMRASGKYTAVQTRDTILDRIRKGIYTAPGRAGISYMLAPMMRTYPGKPDNDTAMTMSMPHFMIYAPYITSADIGTNEDEWPILVHPESLFLGETKAPYGYIIMPADKTERTKIVNENKDLLKRLSDYRPYLSIQSDGAPMAMGMTMP
jgi:hypothetical protein